jgi:hypothetical protein
MCLDTEHQGPPWHDKEDTRSAYLVYSNNAVVATNEGISSHECFAGENKRRHIQSRVFCGRKKMKAYPVTSVLQEKTMSSGHPPPTGEPR